MSRKPGDCIIFDSENADRTVEAFVEQDDRAAFFYLSSQTIPDFGLKPCWVRNLVAAPPTLDVEGMRKGTAPLQPTAGCRHPQGSPPLDPEKLSIVWLEEGTGAALLDGDEVVALIPPWAGHGGFPGYARDAIGTGELAWELQPGNQLLSRVNQAREWWQQWEAGSPWDEVQRPGHAQYVEAFGPEKKYYATDGGHWPPCALLRFERPDGEILLSLGMRLRPQPNVPEASGRRIELAIFVERGHPEGALLELASYLSGQCRLPWMYNTWFGHGHTLPCNALPGFAAVVLSDVPPVDAARLAPAYRGDPVSVLWMIPITGAQREAAIADGSEALLERLRRDGVRGAGTRKRNGFLDRLLGRTS